MKPIYPLILCGALALTACGKAEQAPAPTETQTQATASEPAPTQATQSVPASLPTETEQFAQDDFVDKVIVPANTPVIELGKDGESFIETLRYAYFANLDVSNESVQRKIVNLFDGNNQKIEDGHLMYYLSLQYINETDRFKQQELLKTVLPQLQQKIKEYKRDYMVRIPFDSSKGKPITPKQAHPDYGMELWFFAHDPKLYNFETKSFEVTPPYINRFGTGYNYLALKGESRRHKDKQYFAIQRSLLRDNALLVEDHEKAHRIENAIKAKTLGQRGSADYFLKNHILHEFEVTVEYFDTKTGEVYANKVFTFEDVEKGK